MRQFSEDRDWAQFHDPKSLILALVGEVGELAELFQWLPADTARAEASHGRMQERAGEEMADVLLYLIRLADILDVDLSASTRRKLAEAESRFDAGTFQGIAPIKD